MNFRDKTDEGYVQAALDAASREVHMMLLREGSSWGVKACEEIGRVFMTAYRNALPFATPDRNAIIQAAARGWCSPANQHKEMDAELAAAIADEIMSALKNNAAPQGQHPSDAMGQLADGQAVTGGRSESRAASDCPSPAGAAPFTLAEQIARAKAEVAAWSEEKRRSVQLEGWDPYDKRQEESEMKDDGGPAFPVIGQPVPGGRPLQLAGQLHHGMTLRDYFAAKCLPIAFQFFDKGYCGSYEGSNADIFAECAYQLADAMLKARGE